MVPNEVAGPNSRDSGNRRFGIDRAKRMVVDTGRSIPERTGALFGWGRGKASSLLSPERPETAIQEAPFFRPFPEQPIENEFLNLLWRSEALLAIGAILGQAAEDQLIHWTRELFHDRLSHRELSRTLFGHDYAAIHTWMDKVPGSEVIGGGILHRLQHGHDFPALREIYERHGLPGALVWMQHNTQDLATPTGVPLPIGSGKLADWLVSKGIASPGKAALAVSLNAIELSSAVLAGVYITRLAALVREELRKHRIRQRCQRARDAYLSGDFDGAIANYSEAYAMSDRSPLIALSLGWCYAEMKPARAEAFLAFREAAHGLALTDPTIQLCGLQVSLRGVAYLLALGQAPRVLSDQHMRVHWKDELERMWRGAIVSFEQMALQQSEPVDFGPIGVEWRRRPLSAAANYYLAARASLLVPFLPQGDVLRLARKSDELLVRAGNEYPAIGGNLTDVRSRWAVELRPWETPLLEMTQV